MVNEPLLGKAVLNMADRCFAKESKLKLFAEGPRESRGPQAPLPVVRTSTEFVPAVLWGMVQKDARRDRALGGMSQVVDVVGIAV